jgi:hypothetical protein
VIRTQIDEESVVGILAAAANHRAFSLKEICLEYVRENFRTVRQTESFKALVTEPEILMDILLRIK